MYSKIINKCKYQMAHKPSKQKTSCTKKMFQQKHITSIPQNHTHNTTKKHKNSSMYMATKSTPSRTSTYERPFTHEGNYLVFNRYSSIVFSHAI